VRSLIAALALVLLGASLAACFSAPAPSPGTVKCSGDAKRPCPHGYVCANDYCVFPDLATPRDAGDD
jgi:hypothetical protein